MSELSALHSLFDDTIKTGAEAELAEEKVARAPQDLEVRAQLIHYYYNIDLKTDRARVSRERLNHISWFITNQPDLEFCGTAPFRIDPADPQFQSIKQLWQKTINCPIGDMARINACMFVANANQPEGQDMLRKMFPNSTNLWASALLDLLTGSGTCFSLIAEAESLKPFASNAKRSAELLEELKTVSDWNSAAIHSALESEVKAYVTQEFHSDTSLSAMAEIAGCSVFRFESSSMLGFNPEILALRFKLACWIIRHIPSTDLATSPIFMGPFECPSSYDIFIHGNLDSLKPLLQVAAKHWMNQLHAFPEDKRVANGAAKFAIGADPKFPELGQSVASVLRKTSVGTESLRRNK